MWTTTTKRFLGCMLCTIAVWIAYKTYYPSQGVGVSATVANRMLEKQYRIPSAASDVAFYVDFGGCAAEFALDESNFISWCRNRGWSLTKIDKPVTHFYLYLRKEDRVVARGYTFSIRDGRGVYDADKRQATFWVSTFP